MAVDIQDTFSFFFDVFFLLFIFLLDFFLFLLLPWLVFRFLQIRCFQWCRSYYYCCYLLVTVSILITLWKVLISSYMPFVLISSRSIFRIFCFNMCVSLGLGWFRSTSIFAAFSSNNENFLFRAFICFWYFN